MFISWCYITFPSNSVSPRGHWMLLVRRSIRNTWCLRVKLWEIRGTVSDVPAPRTRKSDRRCLISEWSEIISAYIKLGFSDQVYDRNVPACVPVKTIVPIKLSKRANGTAEGIEQVRCSSNNPYLIWSPARFFLVVIRALNIVTPSKRRNLAFTWVLRNISS